MLPVIWMLCSAWASADSYVRQPSIDVLLYDISLEVRDTSDSIAATAKIQVRIRNRPISSMWLDLEDMSVDRLLVGGLDRPFTSGKGRLAFAFGRKYFPGEAVLIEVQYHGTAQRGLLFGKSKYGRRVVFADNWPDRAHHWFPSIDHPSDKAAVSFSITAPEKYEVVAPGRPEKTTQLPGGRELTKWTEAKAIPTYCMVFGIAEFSISRSAAGVVPISWYVFPEDSESVGRKFDRTASILALFESLIGPYPYEKLAHVQSIIQLGAMENSSAIFYSEALFRESPVLDEIAAHEIAHQWFGDSVTEFDWDHLWLSEGFATYFEALIDERLIGPEALSEKMARHAEKIAAYAPARDVPVVDPRQTDPSKKLTPLNYEKGAWILHMLRGMLGDEIFFKGIRRFYGTYEGGNVSSEEFQKVMESVSRTNLGSFFRQWLYQPGWPQYSLAWRWDKSARELEISVRQAETGNLFDMPVEILVSAGDSEEIHKFRIYLASHILRIPLGVKPSRIDFDPNNWVLKSVVGPGPRGSHN